MNVLEFLLFWAVGWFANATVGGLFLKFYDPSWPRWLRRAVTVAAIPFMGLGVTMLGVDDHVWDEAVENLGDQWS